MSFEKVGVADLRRIATEEFGLEFDTEKPTKAEVIAAFAENDISFETAAQFDEKLRAEADTIKEEVKKEQADAKAAEEKVLLKMLRANKTYEIRGVIFKDDHPFALVPESDAEYIVENDPGFRYATPREAQEFYG
jgi:hypothetical protein